MNVNRDQQRLRFVYFCRFYIVNLCVCAENNVIFKNKFICVFYWFVSFIMYIYRLYPAYVKCPFSWYKSF